MMPLQSTRDPTDDAFKDLLKDIQGVTRIDELHTTTDDDWHWVFVIWADSDQLTSLQLNAEESQADVYEVAPGLYVWSEEGQSS